MMPLTESGWLGASGALLAAPAIGFAFGWFLERGGLGHAPKLAGQFYLTDLTVFKVMFTVSCPLTTVRETEVVTLEFEARLLSPVRLA